MGQILTLCSPRKREDTHSNTANASLEEPSRILTFNSKEEWRAHFNASNKMMVIDFSASWCGPCRFIEPAVIKLAAKFTDVDFLKIDVDELPEVAQEFGVEAMPTFFLFKQGKEVDKVVGANSNLLEEKIKKHISHK